MWQNSDFKTATFKNSLFLLFLIVSNWAALAPPTSPPHHVLTRLKAGFYEVKTLEFIINIGSHILEHTPVASVINISTQLFSIFLSNFSVLIIQFLVSFITE